MIKKNYNFLKLTVLAILINPILWFSISAQKFAFTNGRPIQKGLDAEPYIDTPTRQKIDLSGKWDVLLEKNSFLDKITNKTLQKEIEIPASIDFCGRMVFQRSIYISNRQIKDFCFKLVALGMNYEAEVLVNDIPIGKHAGGYIGFELDIPDGALLPDQNNVIKIIVSNELNSTSTIPLRKRFHGWKNYGGILRDIYLLATPRLYISDLSVNTSLDEQLKSGTIRVEGKIFSRNFGGDTSNSKFEGKKEITCIVNVELYERFTNNKVVEGKPQKLVVFGNEYVSFQTSVKLIEPKLWKPETPNMYMLRTVLLVDEGKTQKDECSLNLGFASFRIKGNSLLLNGEKAVLNGVVWHEGSPDYGASLTYEQMEKDVITIKSLGANAVRFAYHPPHPYMLNLCSRYGLMVLEEMPVRNVPSDVLCEDEFIRLAENQAREMLDRDGRFPCIVAWGIGTQFDTYVKKTEKFLEKIVSAIRERDDRPIYYGTSFILNDACVSKVDFVGIELPSCELTAFQRLVSSWKILHPSIPLVILGYTKEVEHKNRNGFSDPMSQEAQARFYIQSYRILKELGTSASFIDAFADWRNDNPMLTYGFDNCYVHPFGLVNEKREKRLAYNAVRSLYSGDKIPLFPAGKHHEKFPWIHIVVGFIVIILLGKEYNDRRFSQSLKRALTRTYNFFVDLKSFRAASLFHTLIFSFLIFATIANTCSGLLYHFRSNRFVDYVLTYILTFDFIKERIVYISWNLLDGILILFVFFFVLAIIVSFILKLFAVLIKSPVKFSQIYSIVTWGSAPVIFLSPLSMALFRILENTTLGQISLVIIILTIIWSTIRILKGVSVVFEYKPLKLYLIAFMAFCIIFAGLYLHYANFYGDVEAYIKFTGNMFRGVW